MADKVRFEPESFQIVSDLGQMRLFANPMKMRVLRILQRQEATVDQLAAMVEEPGESIARHIRELVERRLVKKVDPQVGGGKIKVAYRATALIYQLRPDPVDISSSAPALPYASVAAASIDAVASELVTSVETWPGQRMNYEGRRAHLSSARVEEFNEKLVQLVDEYWGSPDEPFTGDPDDPLLAFVGFWYRFPEDQ